MPLWLRRLFVCWWDGCGGIAYTTTCTYPRCHRESLLTHPACYDECTRQAPYWKCSICGKTSDE